MGSFKLKNNTKLNEINKAESSTYLKLFDVQEKAHKEMENATFSFLDTIPDDVETIADVGAGPGIVNRYIPSKYKVLAIDMDEEILKRNHCDTCLGDILDLPLENQSVDMAFACDVLEHIEPASLERAVSEMKRVSQKYIYLQTPNEEILRYSIAWCPNCGNKWHVNFHKNSFSECDFYRFQDDNWEIIRINYTGDVDNQSDNPAIYKIIEEGNKDIYRVQGFMCPKCGSVSKTKNIDQLYEMEKEDNLSWRVKQIKPKYSEIGVLFRRKQNTKKISLYGQQNSMIKVEQRKSNHMDFRKKQRCNPNYSGREQIPFVVLSEDMANFNKKGLVIKKNGFVTLSFPTIGNDASLRLRICSRGKAHIKVVGIGQTGEVLIGEGDCSTFKPLIIENVTSESSIIRLYSDEELIVRKVTIIDEGGRFYYFYSTKNNERELYKLWKGNVFYSYLIPKGGIAFGQEQ